MMSLQKERLGPLAANLPGLEHPDLLDFISPPSPRHDHVSSDFDEQWIDYVVTKTDNFEVWKDTTPARYLHLSGTPRSGKTTCLAALTRHLQGDDDLQRRKQAAVVTLFLDAYGFDDQQDLSPLDVILRAILRELVERLLPTLENTYGDRRLDTARLRSLIKTSIKCLPETYVLVDNIHLVPGLSGEDIFLELRDLDIRWVMFTGLPLNRLCAGDMSTTCDNCEQPSLLWAECEACNCCYCPQCHETRLKCCAEMKGVLAVVEIPLEAELSDDYIEHALSGSTLSSDQQAAATNVLGKIQDSLPLAKLALNEFLEKPELVQLESTRDRLSLSTLRFFNLALCRVKFQRSQPDVDLGLAVLAVVSLAGPDPHTIGFYALQGILLKLRHQLGNPQLFGDPLSRVRISRVTLGWIQICRPSNRGHDTPIKLFHVQAETYLIEECSGFHAAALGDKGRDLALICLETLSKAVPDLDDLQSHLRDMQGDNPSRALFRYALENWGRHFAQYSSEATRVAAYEFLNQYQNSTALKTVYRRLSSYRSSTGRTAVGHPIHLLAAFALHELLDQLAGRSAALNVVDVTTGLTPAMVACNAESTAFVRKLLSGGPSQVYHSNSPTGPKADFTLKCRKGNTALWYAIQSGSIRIVRYILHQQGFRLVNQQDKRGMTPLMLAIDENVEHKFDDILQLLLDSDGLKLETTDKFGRNALHVAAMRADHSVVEFMLQRAGARRMIDKCEENSVGRTPLMLSLSDRFISDRSLETVKLLIRYGADTRLSDSKGRTVLHYAASSNASPSVLAEILKTKIDISARDHQQYSALQVARAFGAEQVVKTLSEKLSGIEQSDRPCIAPSLVSEQQDAPAPSRTDTTASEEQAPRHKDPDVSRSTVLHYTELHTAVHQASRETVQRLLSATCDLTRSLDDRTIDGDTALHSAIRALADAEAEFNDDDCVALEDIIRMLLDRTDLTAENDLKEKVIELAARLVPNRHEILNDIIEATMGSKVDVRSIRISEPLPCLRSALIGERRRSPQLIEVLIEAGASVFKKIRAIDRSLKFPREVAEEQKLGKDVVDMLIKWEEAVDAI